MNCLKLVAGPLLILLLAASSVRASEADLAIPDLKVGKFDTLGGLSAWWLLFWGALVITGTLGISLYLRSQIQKLPAHRSMLGVADIIYATCKTYLLQQGKFLLMLFVFIAIAMCVYLVGFGGADDYVMSDRIIQELKLANREGKPSIPLAVVDRLKELIPAAGAHKGAHEVALTRERFIRQMQDQIPAEWPTYGKEI